MKKDLMKATNFKKAITALAAAKALFDLCTPKDLSETSYKEAFIVNSDSLGYLYSPDDDTVERLTKSIFAATAYMLSIVKEAKTDKAACMLLTDVVGNFKFAAFVQYNENTENPEEPGNWSFSMTFNEEDINELEKKRVVKKILYSDGMFKSELHKVAHDVGGITIRHDSYVHDAAIIVIDTLLMILDREAVEGDVVDIEMPGFFTASVGVEDDEKVFSITPGAMLKTIIKDDKIIEK